ncbi:ribose 5-phosphate isomerase B [Vibrio sinensis]|uniref:Ribose 5-phosphate isomerase B n=1 Tax=Vibrio sinensis TaxID=2302434 RepID=A0A3A6R322_9VIBR|nr:ribose 5-phosphate isomerase B [Vibrio sinensis]RJX75299.1 ribose 5-phosphate isomerase B [Vibrio sinensis]
MKKIIAIANDHVGIELKSCVIEHLKKKEFQVIDLGTNSTERTDYPQYGVLVANEVTTGKADLGILICGTGVGISLAANKVHGVRAVVCSDPYTAQLSKQHNDTNILAFGARVIGSEVAKMIIDCWLEARFEGGRHLTRVEQISAIENN